MAAKRIVAAAMGNGHIGLVEQDVPEVKPGAVLVDVHNSLVSPGTELAGWRNLRNQLDNPNPDAKPNPFGYSNAGVVAEVGEGVTEFKPGDRVACIGGGYALHTDVAVVPHNLCVALPGNVTFAQGSYGMLAATAVQCVRRCQPELGESFATVGLGPLGQLTAQLLRMSGCFVIGWDRIAFRCELAKKCGAGAAVVAGEEDEVAATRAFTDGYGIDGAVFAFFGEATEVYDKVNGCLKCTPDGHRMGRIVVVGGAHFKVGWAASNADVRIAARTGPGYHDEPWEFGPDYPPVFMRWTTRTNLALCMRLISEGKLDVDSLTTHTIPLKDVDEGIGAAIKDPDSMLGVVFDMKG